MHICKLIGGAIGASAMVWGTVAQDINRYSRPGMIAR